MITSPIAPAASTALPEPSPVSSQKKSQQLSLQTPSRIAHLLFALYRTIPLSNQRNAALVGRICRLPFTEALDVLDAELNREDRINAAILSTLLQAQSSQTGWECQRDLFVCAPPDCLSAEACLAMMIAAGKRNDRPMALHAFNTSRKYQWLSSDFLLHTISTADKTDSFAEAGLAFSDALKYDLLTHSIFESYSAFANRMGYSRHALDILAHSPAIRQLGEETLCTFIQAASRMGDHHTARQAFCLVLRKRCNIKVINTFINESLALGRYSEILSAFHEARERGIEPNKILQANRNTQNNFKRICQLCIHILYCRGELHLARQVLATSELQVEKKRGLLNMQNMPSGVAIVLTDRYLRKRPEINQLGLQWKKREASEPLEFSTSSPAIAHHFKEEWNYQEKLQSRNVIVWLTRKI